MSEPSTVISIDAPVEGWNAFDGLDSMPATAAVILENIIPGAGRADTRGGSDVFADTGTGDPVESIMPLNGNEEYFLIAASGGGLFDITGGSVSTLVAEETYSNDRWQHSNFRKQDESSVLIMTNGEDSTQVFNGVSVSNLVITGSTGLPNSQFVGSLLFKGRMYYWFDNDNSFWFAQAGSYQGVLKEFDLGSQTQLGGHLVAMSSWTQQDSGDGKDDFLVFLFSTGETLIYQGDDPETIGFFELVGRYQMGEPMGVRGFTKYGSDLIVMTKDGYVALSTIVQQGRISDVPAFSRLIHTAITERTSSKSDLFGWECVMFQREGLFIFNVPLSGTTFEQHVMNTVTQRWCKFTGLNPICLAVQDSRLYGGRPDGTVNELLSGTSDAGVAINFSCLYAYNGFDNYGYQKLLTAAQIISTHPNPSEIELSGFADYDSLPNLSPLPGQAATDECIWGLESGGGSVWDEDYWVADDNVATTKGWQNVSASGYAVALLVRFALTNDRVTWRSTGLRYYMIGAQ